MEITNEKSENAECCVCGQNRSKFLFKNKDRLYSIPGIFRIVRCEQCGLVYISPRPREISKYYPDIYTPYNARQDDFFQAISDNLMSAYYGGKKSIIDNLKSFLYKLVYNSIPKTHKGRILDVGCGNGLFLYNLRKYGWDVYGFDMSRKAVDFARRQLGLKNVIYGFLEEMEYPDGYFDVITMNHVIEHVSDPKGALIKIKKILENGGLLIITTPNTDSLNFKLFGKYWFPLETPRHLNLFNHATMKMILNDAGFFLDKSACDFSTDQLMRSINYLAGGAIIKKIRLIFLPLMFILSVFKKSDIITFYARKQATF